MDHPVGSLYRALRGSVSAASDHAIHCSRHYKQHIPVRRDSRVVSVLGLECRRPGFESRYGQRNLVMELVNIYLVLSCSFVEIFAFVCFGLY